RVGNLLARRGRFGYTHPEPIETAISLALEEVADELPAALTLLRLFAFLPCDAIPTDLLADGVAALDGPLRALASEDLASQATFILRQISLIQHSTSTNTFHINRIVQTIVREKIPKKAQRQWVQRVVRLIYTVFPSADFENWSLCEKYLIQAKECAHLIEEFGLVEDEAAQLLLCLGSYRLQRAYYQEAEQYFNQALHICQALETLASTEHPGTSYALNSLALLYHMRGHYQQAEDIYHQALELRKNAAKPDQHAVAQTYNNLANLYKDQGKLQQSVERLRQAIEIDEQALGRDHPETAKIKSNLAFLYDEQGYHRIAEDLHTQVYNIMSQNLPVGHPDIALSLNALATNAVAQGDYQRAETLYRDAIFQQEQHLGSEHSDTLQSLNNLAYLYTRQAKYQEAEPLYQQVLAIYEHRFGHNHPLTAVVLTNLGWLYHLMQQEDFAENLLRRSLAINEQVPGKDTLDTYSCISMIARFLIDQQRYEDAYPFSQRALKICQDRYGPENQRTLEAQEQQRIVFKGINDRHRMPNDVFLEQE
ncbi:MAG: tetratricopeptide repeat protein, partial [Ktedonobacteraceae bacterium]